MKWIKEDEYEGDDIAFMRWRLKDEAGNSIAVLDHNMRKGVSSLGRVWEYHIKLNGGWAAFPPGRWSLEKRQAYVTALVRLS